MHSVVPHSDIDDIRFASEWDRADDPVTIDAFTPSGVELMSPESKAVYIQCVKDSEDDLLVDGFFRQSMPDCVLPAEVNRIIGAYYLKSYSIRRLHEILQPLCMVTLYAITRRTLNLCADDKIHFAFCLHSEAPR